MTLGREYRQIWTGSAVSNLGDGITFVALPLLAATITQDPAQIAALSIFYSVPRLLSVLGIGVLVDRLDRRRLLFFASLSRSVLFAVVTLLVLADMLPMAGLYMVYAVMGVVETLSDSAAVAVLPSAVRTAELDRANSRIAGAQIVLDEFIGPPLGGVLFALAAFAPIAVNAAAYLAAGLIFLRLRGSYVAPPSERGSGPEHGFVAQIREGAAWAFRHPIVRTLIVVGGVASVGYMIPFSYLVLYAQQVLGLTSTGYGLLLSFSAVGGLVGSVVASRLRRRIGYAATIVAALGLGAVAFTVIAATTTVWVVAVALAAYICHAVVWNVMATAIRQRVTPAVVIGRVGAVSRLVSLVGLAVGAGLGGWLASAFGFRIPFLVAASCFVVGLGVVIAARRQFLSWESTASSQEP